MNVCTTPRTVRVREESYEVPCGSRYCAACGLRWQGDMRVQAVAASEHIAGGVALVTVTAPGRGYFAALADGWVRGEAEQMDWWNDEAREHWRLLHLWASRPLRAWASAHAPGWRLLFRSWEYQKRGALHLHLVLPFGTPEERRVTRLYVWNLWAAARRYRFGYVLAGDKSTTPSWSAPPTVVPADGPAVARYVCKYVASTGAGKEGMVQVAQRTAQRGSVLYITPTLTQASGVNMTKLRARRRIFTRYPEARESHEGWKAACLVDSIQRGHPPLTRESVRRLMQAARATGADLWVDAGTGEHAPPTDAPPPLQMGRTCAWPRRPGGRLVVVLASVLLPDPSAPWLGPVRSEASVIAS